jgi:AAA domain
MANVRSRNQQLIHFRRARDIQAPPVRHVIADIVPQGMVTVLSGKDGLGKTLLTLEMARAVRKDKPFLGKFAVMPGPVWAMLLDDPVSMIVERLRALRLHKEDDLWIMTDETFMPGQPVEMLAELKARVLKGDESDRPRLIILDALYLLLPEGQGTINDPGAMGPVMYALNQLAHATGAAVVVITHDAKGRSDVAGSFAIKAAAKVILRLARPFREGLESSMRELIIDKNKLGPRNRFRVRLDGVGTWTLLRSPQTQRLRAVKIAIKHYLMLGRCGSADEIAREIKHPGRIRSRCWSTSFGRGMWRPSRQPRVGADDRRSSIGWDRATSELCRVGSTPPDGEPLRRREPTFPSRG